MAGWLDVRRARTVVMRRAAFMVRALSGEIDVGFNRPGLGI